MLPNSQFGETSLVAHALRKAISWRTWHTHRRFITHLCGVVQFCGDGGGAARVGARVDLSVRRHDEGGKFIDNTPLVRLHVELDAIPLG